MSPLRDELDIVARLQQKRVRPREIEETNRRSADKLPAAGLSAGYTPVCDPAIPTEPAGTRSRGVARRGAAIRGSTVPKYGKPGRNPIMNTRYVRPVCRATTSASDSPANAATSARSGPSGPPYFTGMRFGDRCSGRPVSSVSIGRSGGSPWPGHTLQAGRRRTSGRPRKAPS